MSIINNGLLLASEAAAAGGYTVSRSLRFNAADSAFLSRTFGSAGNRRTATFSFWLKKSNFSADQTLFSCGSTGGEANEFEVYFGGNGADISIRQKTSNTFSCGTTAVFRDPSAWYHIVLSVDTTQATAANRLKLYVNNVEQVLSGTLPTQNTDLGLGSATTWNLGRRADAIQYINGYLAEVHYVDGSALTPASFGETNATTGQWVPKAFSGGSYGTNGFRLTFSDNSGTTATTLGKDAAGSNNWTPNNFSVAAGAGNDSLVDSPTSYGTDASVGGEVRGNYCTWNPLEGSSVTLSNGNLDATGGSATTSSHRTIGTISANSGKWYYEITLSTNVGASPNLNVGVGIPGTTTIYAYDLGNSLGASSGDVIGVAFDAAAGRLWVAKNGTWVSSGNPAAGTNAVRSDLPTDGRFLTFANQPFNSVTYSANFGQRPFAYTAPSGFKALCDTSLPAPAIANPSTVFDTRLYTGNGSTQAISGLGFSPDLVWIKERNAAVDHALYDIVRGAQARLESNTTDAEATSDSGLTAFNSDGFSLSTLAQVNTNSDTYVAWCWDCGSSNSSNTSGTISSTVRVNASAGCSVVTWTGTGTAGTIGHGLGAAPRMFITKRRNGSSSWRVYHANASATPQNGCLFLEGTQAFTTSTIFNNTAPTSTTFGVGTDPDVNTSGGTYVAYCFAPVAGYSSFGSYVGNGSASDGPFVFCGFRPKLVLARCSSGVADWWMYDSVRGAYNVNNAGLRPNLSNAETSDAQFEFLSNGFKIRTSGTDLNSNGGTHIFCAWAENPFQYARAR